VTLSLFPVAEAASIKVINEQSYYPEQPYWYRNNLYYAEMSKDRVMRWDGVANTPFWTSPGCGPTSVAKGAGNSFIILCHLKSSLAKVDLSGRLLQEFDRDVDGARFSNPNGSTNDAKGGVYFTSAGIFARGAPATGALYHLGADEKIRKVAGKIWYANGVALSHNGERLFVSEHLGRRILSYKVLPNGALGERTVFLELNSIVTPPDTSEWWVGPDGLAVDASDNLYIAEYGAGRLIIVNGSGKLQKTLYFEEKFITAPRFGEEQRTLFITAPSSNNTPPFVGKVYQVQDPLR
jgi:gluconolactonase